MRHPEGRDVHQRVRLRVGGKFFLAVGIVLLAMLGVTASGAVGLARLQSKIDLLYDDNIVTSQATTGLELALANVEQIALEQVATVDPTRKAVLDRDLDEDLIPRVDRRARRRTHLISADPGGPGAHRGHLDRLQPLSEPAPGRCLRTRRGQRAQRAGRRPADRRPCSAG